MASLSDLWDRLHSRRDQDPDQEEFEHGHGSDSESSSSKTSQASEHGQRSEGSTSSEPPSDSESLSVQEKRRRQTAKARAAAITAKLRRKMAKQCAVQCPDPFSEYLPDLQNKQPFQHSMHPGRRARLVYSWIRGACAFLNNFFLQQQCHHVISISVVDDTNMRLAAQVTGKWYSSRTVSVLNNVQTCVACFDMDPDPSHAIGETCRGYRSFPLHTPLTCLPRATARNLFQEIRSWLVCEAGSRWQQFGLKADLFDKTPFLCQVMCFDSLSTNVQLFKMLRRASFQKQQAQQAKARPDQSHLLVGTPCAIHQIALARKALLFYHPNFWSSLVRLSHLFSTQNFRLQFRSSLFSFLADNFQHISVDSLPREHGSWQRERQRLCKSLLGELEGTGRSYSRLTWHKALAKFDNGNPRASTVTHWCQGHCCRGTTVAEKSDYSFMMVCKLYYYLFAFGYAVPLTYRWKHAQPALEFCSDTCLHQSDTAQPQKIQGFQGDDSRIDPPAPQLTCKRDSGLSPYPFS